jgi:hypothetical protein
MKELFDATWTWVTKREDSSEEGRAADRYSIIPLFFLLIFSIVNHRFVTNIDRIMTQDEAVGALKRRG